MADLPNLDAARAARIVMRDIADLRHTYEPVRYTCPECGEVLLRRDPNDLCPAKVAARLAAVDILTAELAALKEREAATNAWLIEHGHLSLLALGAELTHLRDQEREMQYAYDCCASFAKWANAPTNRAAHNMEHMPPVTADDAFSVVFPILQKERADLAAFANRVGAVISGRSYADVEENLRVDELPAVATQVAAQGERAVRAERERDRLRDILAAERGERAPEGWDWCPLTGGVLPERVWMSLELRLGFVVHHDGKWHWSPAPDAESVPFDYALEAIEHAIGAVKEAPRG